MLLPVEPFPVSSRDIALARSGLRDLRYNPDRHLDAHTEQEPNVRTLVEQKQHLIRQAGSGSPDGPHRFEQFRSISRSLQPWVAERTSRLRQHIDHLTQLTQYNQVLTDREYTFWVHPEERLHGFYDGLIRADLSNVCPTEGGAPRQDP